jgi:hypothetical protein
VAVEVGADGACTVAGRPVDLAALRGSDIILRASRKTPSRHVIAAADQVKAGGTGRVAFELTD